MLHNVWIKTNRIWAKVKCIAASGDDGNAEIVQSFIRQMLIKFGYISNTGKSVGFGL